MEQTPTLELSTNHRKRKFEHQVLFQICMFRSTRRKYQLLSAQLLWWKIIQYFPFELKIWGRGKVNFYRWDSGQTCPRKRLLPSTSRKLRKKWGELSDPNWKCGERKRWSCVLNVFWLIHWFLLLIPQLLGFIASFVITNQCFPQCDIINGANVICSNCEMESYLWSAPSNISTFKTVCYILIIVVLVHFRVQTMWFD